LQLYDKKSSSLTEQDVYRAYEKCKQNHKKSTK
jgi:hypothetical protein